MNSQKKPEFLERRCFIRSFDKAAESYHQAAFSQHEIADRLLDRLEFLKIEPGVILEIGAKTGYLTNALRQRFPKSQLIAADCSHKTIQKMDIGLADQCLCADPENIPLSSGSVDLVIANLVWNWSNQGADCFQEWRRILKPGGLLLFTALGPDTLYELRASFSEVDDQPHVHLFLDMHDVGDIMLSAHFGDTVMQAERIQFSYSGLTALWYDLQKTGLTNALCQRRRTLTGKQRWRKMETVYSQFILADGSWPATVEVIYGVGWAHETQKSNEQGEVFVPLSSIKSFGGSHGS